MDSTIPLYRGRREVTAVSLRGAVRRKVSGAPEPEEALLRQGETEGVAAGPVSAARSFDREEDKDGRTSV
jgi:hypothetical protein